MTLDSYGLLVSLGSVGWSDGLAVGGSDELKVSGWYESELLRVGVDEATDPATNLVESTDYFPCFC